MVVLSLEEVFADLSISQAEAALALWLAPLGAGDCQTQDLKLFVAMVVSSHQDDSTPIGIIEVFQAAG
jgi:hypothetical protein